VTHVPGPTLVLAIIHGAAYLGVTATTVWGETPRHRTRWVRAYREPLRRGATDAVIAAVEDAANDPTETATPRPVVQRTRGASRRHRPSLHADEALARGRPLGTGVVEGAWGHLGNAWMEPSERRWTTTGAQAVLALWAVRLNGPWEVDGPCHRPPPHHRPYGPFAPAPELTAAHALKRVASSSLSTDFGHAQILMHRYCRIIYTNICDKSRRGTWWMNATSRINLLPTYEIHPSTTKCDGMRFYQAEPRMQSSRYR
jgi:hypothetical protein